MKFRVLSLFAALVLFSMLAFGQDLPFGTTPGRAVTMGPGDEITVKVLGEPQFDFVTAVDEEGNIEVPFVKEHLVAKCRTERELRTDVTKKLSVYLRDPQVNLRVTDRKSRPPVSVYGEVVLPQQVTLVRRATLREVLAFAGGPKEKSSGMVQVYRTRAPVCSASDEAEWKNTGDGNIPSRFYSVSSVQKGGEESNPQIFPGDLIVVGKAPPVYVIGQVKMLKEITIGENGLSLVEAISQAGGFGERAKSKDIKIRRLKANSREREIIAVNYDLIKKGAQKDIMLQPEDIVEVDKAPKSVAQTVLEIVTGSVKNFSNVLPQTILY
jgi:protein involved in polysaccharide export with SLBB domain